MVLHILNLIGLCKCIYHVLSMIRYIYWKNKTEYNYNKKILCSSSLVLCQSVYALSLADFDRLLPSYSPFLCLSFSAISPLSLSLTHTHTHTHTHTPSVSLCLTLPLVFSLLFSLAVAHDWRAGKNLCVFISIVIETVARLQNFIIQKATDAPGY